jgi:hypothetical protein
MAVSRCKLSISKSQNNVRLEKRKIAEMLLNGKNESARIRAEAVIQEEYRVLALEILALRCELLSNRIQLIAQSPHCPDDLFMPIATMIYCAQRLELKELVEACHQFAAKYGNQWVNGLLHGERYIDPQVLKYLSVEPPKRTQITNFLVQVADECDVDWKPSAEELKLDAEEEEESKSCSSERSPSPPKGASRTVVMKNGVVQKDSQAKQQGLPAPQVAPQNEANLQMQGYPGFENVAAPAPAALQGYPGAAVQDEPSPEYTEPEESKSKDAPPPHQDNDDELDDLAARFNALKKQGN